MAKEQITGIVMGKDVLDWAVFDVVQGQVSGNRSGDLDVSGGTEGLGVLLKAELSGVKGDVVMGLTSDLVLLRAVELPAIEEEEELRGMVELQADKFSPFPIENMVVSHEILRKSGGTCLVLIAAVKRNVVEASGKVLTEAGIQPTHVDCSVLGWWRLLRDSGKINKEGRQVTILIHGLTPEIVVSDDAVPIVLRSLGETQGLSEDEIADEIVREVGYTLMSLELEHGSAEASAVSIWYGADRMEGLAGRMQEEYSCGVTENNLSDLPPLTEGLARRAADPDGASLSLVPQAWTLAEESRMYKKKMIKAATLVVGFWLICVMGFFGGLYLQGQLLERLRAEKKRGEEPAREVSDIRQRVQMLRLYTDLSRSALACFREVSRLMPGEVNSIVWKNFDFKKEKTVKIDGEAVSREIVLSYIKNLNESKLFAKVVPGSEITDPVTHRTRFSITLELPEGAEE